MKNKEEKREKLINLSTMQDFPFHPAYLSVALCLLLLPLLLSSLSLLLFSSFLHPNLCPRFCMCQCHPTPAIIQCPVEVHAPTPPTMDHNGDKAPSAKPHINSRPVQEVFFSPLLKDVCDICCPATMLFEQAASKRHCHANFLFAAEENVYQHEKLRIVIVVHNRSDELGTEDVNEVNNN